MAEQAMEKIMQRIKKRRLELNYSFQDLADLTHMSKSTLQRYESGGIKNLPIDKVAVLAAALKTTVAWIMGYEDEKRNEQEEAFTRLKKGLEPYGLTDGDVQFLLTVMKAHKEKNI